jgi:hemoglobin/transferrin/lactoferrin receptor protein
MILNWITRHSAAAFADADGNRAKGNNNSMTKLRSRLLVAASAYVVAGFGAGFSPAQAQTDASSSALSAAGSTEIHLPVVQIQGSNQVPLAASTVTRVQLQQVPPNEAQDILIGVPGVYAQNDGTPGLSVSVRGMQDFGRVNVMIDGARQDFQVSGHGANGTVYVDPALLANVDVARGTVSTANGAGEIGGAVNLHTIGIDDVLAPGQKIGVLTTDMGGTNNYEGSGMVAGGVRVNDRLDFVGAFSMRSSGDYKDGAGDTVPDTFQRLQSGLIKADIVPGQDQTVQLGGIFYHNDFGTDTEGVVSRDSVNSNTVTAKYHWAPAGDDLVDLHVNGFYAATKLDESLPSFVAVSVAPADDTNYNLTTLGFDADNNSQFPLGPFAASIDYGGEYYHDSVSTTDQTGDTGETPSGNRQLGGIFTQANLGWNIFTLTGALRYDAYSLNGSGTNPTAGITSMAAGPFNVDKSASAVSPKVTLAAAPVPGLQLYTSYGLGFRPPAITETLFAGAHPGLDFVRFIPNPNLDPERSYSWEIGTKLDYHELLTRSDTLTFSGDYFITKIHDYIAETFAVGGLDPNAPFPIPIDGYFYQNTPGTTNTEGFETQGTYDAGFAYLNVAYSNILTKLPATNANSGLDTITTAPPRSVFAATAGLRFLEGKLQLGERTRAVSATQSSVSAETGLAPLVAGYVLEDLFASYQLSPAVKLFASAENIGNRQYFTDALSSIPSPGLTAKFGITVALGR